MQIPRQPDGSRERAPLGADGLRARRQHLVGQQRTVAYWQRLVQARVDLVVAGLLYGAPVPTARSYPVQARPVVPGPGGTDLDALARPPEGLDVAHLLGGATTGPGGPGEHLERLRQGAALLARRRRAVDEELDAVTLALHDRLALDGELDGEAPAERGAAHPVGTAD